ncbi:MAG: TolC family protein, partial [Bacteroidia bacterium]|nr:TolC family protein [Bacteroidia bacterium]
MWLAASASYAQETVRYDFSLQQCIDYALDNHFSVVGAKLDVAATQQQARELISIGFPQINGKFEYIHYFEIPAQVIPVTGFVNAITSPLGFPPLREEQYATVRFGLPNSATASVQMSQMIADGAFFIGLEGAKAYVELSKKNLERTKSETAVSVAKAYYGVLVARERFKLLETNRAQLEKTLENTRALFQNGFAQKLDVDRLEVALNNLTAEIDKTRRLVDFALAALKFQMGMPQSHDLRLTDTLRPDDFNPALAQDTALTPRPDDRRDVVALKQAIRVQKINNKRLRAAYYPT